MNFSDVKGAYFESYLHENSQDYISALKDLEEVYKNNENFYTINYRIGWLYYLLQNYANSLFHLEKALESIPNSVEVLNTQMVVYAALQNWEKVEQIGRATIKINYYDLTTNYWYSLSLTKQEKYKKAIEIDRRILSLYPTSATFLRELGINLFYDEEYEEAKSVFESVIILNPTETISVTYQNKIQEITKK